MSTKSKLNLYCCISLYFLPVTCTVYQYHDKVRLCHISVTQSESCIVIFYHIPHCLMLSLMLLHYTVIIPSVPVIYHGKYPRRTVWLFFYKFHICTPCDMLNAKFSFVNWWLTLTMSLVGWFSLFYFLFISFMLPWLRHLSVAMVLDSCHVCRQITSSTNVTSELFHLLCCTLSMVSILYFQLIFLPLSVCT